VGKGKLEKFAEMAQLPNVIEFPLSRLKDEKFDGAGKWNADFFKNDNPIVLELGCGKGEYTVALARRDKSKNFIGIDIKGARMWKGAKEAYTDGLTNAGFLRTQIEWLKSFFAPGEVDEIWITFPDPQMKKLRNRLTATNFIENYLSVLKPGGIIHLKTDSNFMFTYTCEMVKHNDFGIVTMCDDIYAQGNLDDILKVKTHYETQWLERGITIKYIAFKPYLKPLSEPEVEIPFDEYRSYHRDKRSAKSSGI
jgi:tRNA (guanine-N7-)-methyltransferase